MSSRQLTQTGLFAALIAICAWLSIPIGGITFSMQTFGVFLALLCLGGKWGTVSILIYLLLGAAGMPVFSSFQGGFGVLLGATGGYLWGFLLSGLTYWLLARFGKPIALMAGLAVCYLCGSLWFLYWSGGGLRFILLQCVVPYLIPDGLKLALAWQLARRLAPQLHKTLPGT